MIYVCASSKDDPKRHQYNFCETLENRLPLPILCFFQFRGQSQPPRPNTSTCRFFLEKKGPSITIWLQLIMCKLEGLTCVLEKVGNKIFMEHMEQQSLDSLGCFWNLLFPHSGTKKSGWQTTSPQVKMLGSPLDGLKKGSQRGKIFQEQQPGSLVF